MKYFIYLIAIVLILGINLGLFNSLQIKGQIPNLLFLLVVFSALDKNGYDFFFISLVAGLFLDFYSTSFFGSYTLAFLVLSLSIHFFINNMVVVELNWKSLTLALACCLFLFNILIWFYGLIAFKFNWVTLYTGFKAFMASFPYSFIYNWLLLYPMYIISNSLRALVDNLTIRRRGIIR